MDIGSFMSNMFGGAGKQQQAASQPVTQGNLPAAPTEQAPDTEAKTTTPAEQKSAVDPFEGLWDTKKPDGKPQGLFDGFDPKQLGEVAKQFDFVKDMPPEYVTQLKEAGISEAGITIMMQMMNHASRGAFTQGAAATTRIMQAGLDKGNYATKQDVNNQTRRAGLDSELADTEVFKHPAYAPMLAGLKDQLAAKFPDASPKELAGLANKYMGNFVEAAGGKKKEYSQKETKQTKGVDTQDWEAFLRS